jgi:hypothetical protein
MIGVMMPVGALQDLGRHAQEPCRLPDRNAALHQPSRSRMAQGMWRDPPAQTGQPHGAVEALLHRRDRFTVELNEACSDQLPCFPSPHVGEQSKRYRCRRLASWWLACLWACDRKCHARDRHMIGRARRKAMLTRSHPPGLPVYKPIRTNLATCLSGRRSVCTGRPFDLPE